MRNYVQAGVIMLFSMAACFGVATASNSRYRSTLHMLDVAGHHLAFHVTPGHEPILVFDAGGGEDSSYWADLLPQIAEQSGSELITYDRAGYGQSDEVKAPYKIQASVTDLESGLKQLGATKDVIIVAHSFGGEVDTFIAVKHPDWFVGAVLVDTNLPNFFTERETARLFRQMPKISMNNKENRTTAAIIAAYPRISHEFHKLVWPPQIPCIVIVSENTPFTSSTDARLWRQAHIDFAQAAKNRVLILAKHSSHDVIHDRPNLVIHSIITMITEVRNKTIKN